MSRKGRDLWSAGGTKLFNRNWPTRASVRFHLNETEQPNVGAAAHATETNRMVASFG